MLHHCTHHRQICLDHSNMQIRCQPNREWHSICTHSNAAVHGPLAASVKRCKHHGRVCMLQSQNLRNAPSTAVLNWTSALQTKQGITAGLGKLLECDCPAQQVANMATICVYLPAPKMPFLDTRCSAAAGVGQQLTFQCLCTCTAALR